MVGGASVDKSAEGKGSKVTFYFTNFPDGISVPQLRQFFEVCGILRDVYIARKRNFRGQLYGFLRFLNVRHIDKLALALNNVWIGQCRIWAQEVRYDWFITDLVNVNLEGRRVEADGKVRAVVRVKNDSIKNVRVLKQAEESRAEGEKNIIVGNVEVMLENKERKKKVRRVSRL